MSGIQQVRNMIAAADTATEVRTLDANQLLSQVGTGNLFAISGGRVYKSDNSVVMPVAHGYYVVISLDVSDTYTVRRVYVRAGKATVKGTWADIYADIVGEAAYQASCYA